MNTYSLEQISRFGNLDTNLILRHYKLYLMCKFMERKSNYTIYTKGRAKQIGFSDSTLSRYREDLNMMSPYKATNLGKNVTIRQEASKYVANCHERRHRTSQIVKIFQNWSQNVTKTNLN